jgi:putative MATE family efflux protein
MDTGTESSEKDIGNAVIVEGSILAAIWHMSWPLVLDLSAIAIASFCDTWVAGRLGASEQAAVGIGDQIWFLMVTLAMALSAGTAALVSRFVGAGDKDNAVAAARQSLTFAVIMGASSALFGLVISRPLFHCLGALPKVETLGWQFMRVDLLSQLPFTVVWIAKTIFRATGNARTPMSISVTTTGLTIILEIALCLYPFHFGVAGIGLAWLISGSVAAICCVYMLKSTELFKSISWKMILSAGVSFSWLVRLFKIGLPACIQDLVWCLCNFAMLYMIGRTFDPTAGQAAFAIGGKVEQNLAAMPLYALGMSISTIVGQNLGAKKEKRAEGAAWQAALIGLGYNTIIAAILFFAAEPIAKLMSENHNVIATTIFYLKIAAVSEPFLALMIVLFYAMQGAGYTKWPMWLEIGSLLIVRLPICYLLCFVFSFGIAGIWIGMAASMILLGLSAIWQFQLGKWKLQTV